MDSKRKSKKTNEEITDSLSTSDATNIVAASLTVVARIPIAEDHACSADRAVGVSRGRPIVQ